MLDILLKITVIIALILAAIYSTIAVIKYVIIPLINDIKSGIFNKKK